MKFKITKFWTRIGALFIDSLVVGAFGFILGLLFDDFFVSIGTLGLLIGLVICLVYFTIGYSKIMNGQTLGKKATNIQVIDFNGNYLSVEKSFIRALIILVPFFLINVKIPGIEEDSFLGVLKGLVTFSILIGIILIYILNKNTRQTIHDFAVKSFVTETKQQEDNIELKPIKKSIFLIYGTIVIILVGLAIYNAFSKSDQLNESYSIYHKLGNISEVINTSTSTNTRTIYGKNKSITTSFTTTLWVQTLPESYSNLENSDLVQKAVEIILDNNTNVDSLDFITIRLIRGYNIGIAKKSMSYSISKSPKEWQEIIEEKTVPHNVYKK